MQTTPQQCDSQIGDSNPWRAAVLPVGGNCSLHVAKPTRGPRWRPQALSCPPPREKQARVDVVPTCLERASCFIFPILGKGSTTPHPSPPPGGRLEPQDPAPSLTPLVTASLFSVCALFLLYSLFCCIFRSTYEWYHTVFVFMCLTYFT